MFIGHFAVALGAKKFAPTMSLGTLAIASELADLLRPAFVLMGIERIAVEPGATAVAPLRFLEQPLSHSLVALAFWAVIACSLRALARPSEWASLAVLALVVVSHWLLDVIVHIPDMPIFPRGEGLLGLGLWNSVAATLAVEGLLLAGGVALYWKNSWGVNRKGTYGLWVLVGALLLVYLGGIFGPPPRDVEQALYWSFGLWPLVMLAYWVDRNRTVQLRG